ncbi:nucleoside deaminase [Spiroplasma tabanidicola]|uniref:tRNA-specific adenosine deaminase n=1 Tax=Spiroplasma tabanidicola TaxID=324079 RepID=A0A6I6CH77_9MOLU|nr:deaminase [Spiroplasma tabanidicola]QGS51373.1 tRNA-specific adenosine deaminase [Spiroplasma tabanidicola]
MIDEVWNKLSEKLKECEKSKDVPVAALIFKDKKMYASARNVRFKNKDITGHAEIKAINKVYRKSKSKNLSEFNMVVTLKPCLMCLAAIEQANIKSVFYFLDNLKVDYSRFKTNIIFLKILSSKNKDFEIILKEFFKKLRNNR